jgi:hypothetical protein
MTNIISAGTWIGIAIAAAFFALMWYLSSRKRPAKTSLQTRILFVLQDSYSPMSTINIAAQAHAKVDDVYQVLDQLVSEQRVRASWDGASPYREYSIIRPNKG